MTQAARDAAPASPVAPSTDAPDTGTARANRRRGYCLMLVASLPTMAIAGLVPVLPALFANFRDAPHAELLIPMILTVPSLCVAIFSSPIGMAADRWGRRPVLLAALVAFTVAGLMPFAFDDLYSVIASRFVVGVAEAALLTVGNALMGDYFDGEERRRWLGLQTSIGPFVGSAYVILGGILGTYGWHGPFALYALGLVFLVPAFLVLDEPRLAGRASGDAAPTVTPFPWRTALEVGVMTLLFAVPFFVQNVQHGRIFGDLGLQSPATIGWVAAAASMGTVVGGWLFRTLRPRPVGVQLALALFAYAVCYVGLSLAPNVYVGFPLDAIGQLGCGFGLPVLISWALSRYPPEHRGRGMGLWAASLFLGQFVSAPVLTALSMGRLSFLDSLGLLGVACLVVAVFAWRRGQRSAALHEGVSR